MSSIARASLLLALCAGSVSAGWRDLLGQSSKCGTKHNKCCEGEHLDIYTSCGAWDSPIVCVDDICVPCGMENAPMCLGEGIAPCHSDLEIRSVDGVDTCVCGGLDQVCCGGEGGKCPEGAFDDAGDPISLVCHDSKCTPCGRKWNHCCPVSATCPDDTGCLSTDDEGNRLSCFNDQCTPCGKEHQRGCTGKVCTVDPCIEGLAYHEGDNQCKKQY